MLRLVLLGSLVSLAILYVRYGHGSGIQRAPKERDWLKVLRKMAHGDQDTIDQLIADEARRNPAGHRQQWARAAVERWRADLR
ncbi:MAG: hypothetical protein ACI9U2_001026 [Bradymonadia bacterium]|jgi:hypothetical protein